MSKSKIGDCWILSCCEWIARHEDDICGLDERRLTIGDKMRRIYNGTSLKEKFAKIGLEVWRYGVMLTVYKNKADIPQGKDYIELNDLFFNQNTAVKLDENAKRIIEKIEGTKQIGKFKIKSKFNSTSLDIDCLSTGCKTVLNVMYFPDKIFCLKECGENALEVLFELNYGSVYSDYAMIPFNIKAAKIICATGEKVIEDYEELKGWWESEE